jgi:large subunit ribosomal protein L5
MGVGEASRDVKLMDGAVRDLTIITGQKPIVCKARKSIANFKIREGMPIGCKVTMRGRRMWEFFDRLVNVALPRVRDFRGVSDKGFDGAGNYTLGLRDQLVFAEIDYSKVDAVRGMNITLVTSAANDEGARALLAEMGFPFVRRER